LRKELLAQLAERVGDSHYGEELREPAEEQAPRRVAEAMKRLGWSERDWEWLPKGDRRKVTMARQLRQERTMTLQWIAERRKMGTWAHDANRLYHLRK
jgi:hypothetical protein